MPKINCLTYEARELLRNVTTVWDEYDFEEKSKLAERRVPKFQFGVHVEVMVDEVEHYKNDVERYIRECQVNYGGSVYIFELSAYIENGIVSKFVLDMYVPAGDGVGGVLSLYSERLGRPGD